MTAITAYGVPLYPITSFKFFGIFILELDNDWIVVVHKLQQARQKWSCLSRMLSREGADDQTLGIIYVVVVTAVLLYRLDMWVLTLRTGRLLGIFHHRVSRMMTGQQPQRGRGGGWVYPRWRKRWQMWVYRRWIPRTHAARTQLHSSLQPVLVWTCVWQRRGALVHG